MFHRSTPIAMGMLMWSLLAAWATASAADGEPDPLFGQNGVVVDRLPPPVLEFNGAASAIDAEGRILVGAYVFGTPGHPGSSTLIARYLADGTRDAHFGTAGMTSFTLPGGAPPNSVVVQPDGSMIVVGTTTLASLRSGPFIARLTPGGWPDHAFGHGGFRVVDLGARDVLGLQAVRQDDGRLVLLAHDAMDAIVLIRFLPDGTLDPTFGTSGIVITGGIAARCGGEGLALLGDGGIAVAGHMFSAAHYDMAVFKYRATGDLDPAFATAGVAAFHSVDDAAAHAIAVDARGRIVAAGEVQQLQRLGMVVRLLPDGRPDPAFGAGGVVTAAGIPPADHDSTFRAVACQADGAVLVAGQSPSPTLLHPPITTVGALARFAEDGEPVRAFGVGGVVLSDRTSGTSGEAFTGMLLRTDGRIVALAGAVQQLILCGFRSMAPAYLDLVADAPTLSTVELTWTSPVAGAVSYEVRYARTPITEATWTAATPVPGVPPARAPGSTEHVTVTGLASGTTWYFAYRILDRAGGRSALSRVAGATTLRIDLVRPAAVVAVGGISHTGELLFDLDLQRAGHRPRPRPPPARWRRFRGAHGRRAALEPDGGAGRRRDGDGHRALGRGRRCRRQRQQPGERAGVLRASPARRVLARSRARVRVLRRRLAGTARVRFPAGRGGGRRPADRPRSEQAGDPVRTALHRLPAGPRGRRLHPFRAVG